MRTRALSAIVLAISLVCLVSGHSRGDDQLLQQALKNNALLKSTYVDIPRFKGFSTATQIKFNAKVPTSRKVNGKALSTDITLLPSDIGSPAGSGTSTGTNSGDVTIGTGNGLSLAGQSLSLQTATNSVPGAMSATDHVLLSTALQSVILTSATDWADSTWTPTLTFVAPGNLSVSYTTQTGYYIKMGKVVIAFFYISTGTFTWSTASGALQITGLPFTSRYSTGLNAYGALRWQGITKASYTSMVPEVGANSNYIRVLASGSGQSVAVISAPDVPSGGSVQLLGTIVYLIP